MKRLLMFFIFVLLIGTISSANYYVDNNLSDINVASATPDCTNYNPAMGACGGGTAFAYKNLGDVNALINSFSGTTPNTIYFQRGDKWIFTSNSDSISIKKSNVTLDAFGAGNKPILDGDNQFPTGTTTAEKPIPYGYAIKIGELSSTEISNIYIKNLEVRNMYPGGGIGFSGTESTNGNYTGPGSVTDCIVDNVGWSAISLYRVPNPGGEFKATKIERNIISRAGNWPKNLGWTDGGWPQAISTMSGANYGHECRYNIIYDCYTEGIGATGFNIVEYNVVSDTHSAPIYIGGRNSTVRYNLVWRNSNGNYPDNAWGIRLDDESSSGDNTIISHEIYGNIIIGMTNGIDLRNNPLDGTGWSPMGSVKVYNNLCIDNKKNIVAAFSNRFSNVEIKNNAFIINPDSESECQHVDHWVKSGETADWSGWDWGPNFWYGDVSDTTKGMWSMPFYNSTRDATSSTAPLPKTSGWRSLTSLNDFSFADLTPQETSALVNNLKTEILSGDGMYLTTGTNFSALPANPTFVLTDQDSQGNAWDFGAIIYDFGAGSCIHEADLEPCDGKVSREELNNYVAEWKSNSGASLTQVIEAIGRWKNR